MTRYDLSEVRKAVTSRDAKAVMIALNRLPMDLAPNLWRCVVDIRYGRSHSWSECDTWMAFAAHYDGLIRP